MFAIILVAGCDSSATATPAPTQAQAEAAKQLQGPIKAKGGGGMMPPPEVPKPGEHVGLPPPGNKAGGG